MYTGFDAMQYCHRSLRPACARQTTSVRSPRTSRRAFLSILVAAYTLDMASRILPERTVPMPSGRQIVSPANDREVGPRYEVLGRNRGFRAVRGESSQHAAYGFRELYQVLL